MAVALFSSKKPAGGHWPLEPWCCSCSSPRPAGRGHPGSPPATGPAWVCLYSVVGPGWRSARRKRCRLPPQAAVRNSSPVLAFCSQQGFSMALWRRWMEALWGRCAETCHCAWRLCDARGWSRVCAAHGLGQFLPTILSSSIHIKASWVGSSHAAYGMKTAMS